MCVKPETVIRWHRRGLRPYWRWKSRQRGGCSDRYSFWPSFCCRFLFTPLRKTMPGTQKPRRTRRRDKRKTRWTLRRIRKLPDAFPSCSIIVVIYQTSSFLTGETVQMRKRRMIVSRTEQPKASKILDLLSARPLTERQRQVLDCRSKNLSYAEVGRQLKISAERVRQIEARLRTMAYRISQETSS